MVKRSSVSKISLKVSLISCCSRSGIETDVETPWATPITAVSP